MSYSSGITWRKKGKYICYVPKKSKEIKVRNTNDKLYELNLMKDVEECRKLKEVFLALKEKIDSTKAQIDTIEETIK